MFQTAAKKLVTLQNIENLLLEGESVVSLEGHKKVIAIIGMSGTGKSTFKKLYLKDPSLTVIAAGRRSKTFVFSDGGDKISAANDTSRSKTLIPVTATDTESGALLIDCPGFKDTRGVAEEIAANFMMKRVLDQAEQIKFLVIENNAGLVAGGDRYTIRTLLRHLARFLPNVDALQDSIGLISNKVVRSSDRTLQDEENAVMEALEDFQNGLMNAPTDESQASSFLHPDEIAKMIKIIDIFLQDDEGGKIAVIMKPNKEGSPWDIDYMNECHDHFKDMIVNKLSFANNRGIEYHYSISAESIALIKDDLVPLKTIEMETLVSTLLTSFLQQIMKRIRAESSFNTKINLIINFVADVNLHQPSVFQYSDFILRIINSSDLNLTQEALKTLKNSEAILQFYLQIARIPPSQFAVQVQNTLRSKLIVPLNEYQTYYQFLRKLEKELQYIDIDVHLNRDSFKRSVDLKTGINSVHDLERLILNLQTIKIEISNAKTLIVMNSITQEMYDELNSLLKDNLDYEVVETINKTTQAVTVQGKTVTLSEAFKLFQMHPNASSLKIFAWRTFFVDGNVDLVDANLVILAPYIKVVVPTRIKTLGSDGASYESGKNSGYVYISSLNIENPTRVSIVSQGGEGGKGRPGLDSTCSVPSFPSLNFPFEDAFYKNVYRILDTSEYFYTTLEDREWTTDHGHLLFGRTNYHHKLKIKVSNFQSTTSATIGGPGYFGGHPGNVAIECKMSIVPVFLFKYLGRDGDQGDVGKIVHCNRKTPFTIIQCEGSEYRGHFTKHQGIRFRCHNAWSGYVENSNNIAPTTRESYHERSQWYAVLGDPPQAISTEKFITEYYLASKSVNDVITEFVNYVKK